MPSPSPTSAAGCAPTRPAEIPLDCSPAWSEPNERMTSPNAQKWTPPAVTAAALGLLVVAVLIGRAGASRADAPRFVDSTPWLSWLVLSGLALNVFAALVTGRVLVLRNREQWGLGSGRFRPYLACSIALVLVLVGVRLATGGANPDLPVTGLPIRTGAILGSGMLACIPWLALAWLGHANVLAVDVEHGDAVEVTDQLARLWRLIVTIVSAFTAVVVVAILCSGALRAAFLFAHPNQKDDFPPQNVLLYGAIFAILLALITVPLVASWRSRALRLVEVVAPAPSTERAALETRLQLNLPILRNPVTALNVFAPLVTSFLAAYVPQLGR